MKNTRRCPDCGEWTTLLLCDGCTEVAEALGFTVQERLTMLGAPVELDIEPRSAGWTT